jgi:hypothetical protein
MKHLSNENIKRFLLRIIFKIIIFLIKKYFSGGLTEDLLWYNFKWTKKLEKEL